MVNPKLYNHQKWIAENPPTNGIVKVSTGYIPRPLQDHLHNSLKRFNVLVCHRRFGKTVFAINEMLDQGLRCELRNPQYAYIAPTYGQAKRVAWEYLKDYTKHLPNRTVNEAELRVDIHRPDREDHVRFMLLGAENPDSLLGIYLDGVLLDEYAVMNPVIWSTIIRPALSDRKGWAIFIGTPRGNNHFKQIFEIAKKNESGLWYSAMYKASETGVVDAGELAAAKIEMSDEEFDQEYECSFTAALQGAYYGKYMNDLEVKGRFTAVDYAPGSLVHTAWDLGISDSTAIWFVQEIGKELHVIDYLCEAGKGLEYYVSEIKNRGYVYGRHILPHDAAARELGTGKSRQEVLEDLGLDIEIIPRQNLMDGVNAVRVMLHRCWFDAVKCHDGLECLKNYQRKWDAKKATFLDTPNHDWSSHGADAFRYLALGFRGNSGMIRGNLPRHAVAEYDEFDFMGKPRQAEFDDNEFNF